VHDDVDLPVGKLKLSFGKSSAGHKGVESVMRNLKTKEFYRIRIGIGAQRKIHPPKFSKKILAGKQKAMDIVLKKFTPKDEGEIKKVIKKAVDALICSLSESPDKAMTLYNKS